MKKCLEKNGITLVSLVISIIVLLILAGVSISMLLGDDGIVKQAIKASIYTDLSGIKEKILLNEVGKFPSSTSYLNTDEVNSIISNKKYENQIGVYRDKLYYLTNNIVSETAQYAKSLGFEVLNMTPGEFKYYIELGILQDKVQTKKSSPVGRELVTTDYQDTITIGTNTYSNGWYLIGNYSDAEKSAGTFDSDYVDLGLIDTSHAPYIVNYSNNVVLSIDGMIMYNSEIAVHSFDLDVSALASAIVYVDSLATRTGDYFGSLYSTALYTGTVQKDKEADYTDNNGMLVYDKTDKALLLDNDNAIPVLDINQKYQINDAYTASITINGELNQSNDTLPSTILAISGIWNDYCSWIGIYKNYLHVYSFTHTGSHQNLAQIKKITGFASIDISQYAGQTINIQVSAIKDGKTNVYINGENVCTFDSGDSNLAYKYLTIGDLRVGRNLKFTGKVYDFALFGVPLTEEQIQMNYRNSKAYVEE